MAKGSKGHVHSDCGRYILKGTGGHVGEVGCRGGDTGHQWGWKQWWYVTGMGDRGNLMETTNTFHHLGGSSRSEGPQEKLPLPHPRQTPELPYLKKRPSPGGGRGT